MLLSTDRPEYMQWFVSFSVCALTFIISVQVDCDSPVKMASLKDFFSSIHILSRRYLWSLELPISVLIYTFPNPWQHFLLCCGNSATVIVCLFLKGCLYALDKFSRIWYFIAEPALFSPCPTALLYINTLSLQKKRSQVTRWTGFGSLSWKAETFLLFDSVQFIWNMLFNPF